MDTEFLDKVTAEYKKVKHPDFRVGDVVEVHTKIKEAGKERTQVFKGVVIAVKGAGVSKTFTVRKISYGIGVEKIVPLYSQNVAKIKILKRGKVKRSKLYFLRKKVGKQALKAGVQIPAEGEDLETEFEEVAKEDEVEEKEDKDTTSKSEKKETKGSKAEGKKTGEEKKQEGKEEIKAEEEK